MRCTATWLRRRDRERAAAFLRAAVFFFAAEVAAGFLAVAFFFVVVAAAGAAGEVSCAAAMPGTVNKARVRSTKYRKSILRNRALIKDG